MTTQTMKPTVWTRLKKWLRRLCLFVLCLVVALALSGAIWSSSATRQFYAENPMPGKLVDVGGHKLHVRGLGNDGPTVVYDAGASAGGTYAFPRAAEVAEFARLVLFDRAGYGWSEAGPRPRTPLRLLEEKRTLLKKLGCEPPYILVGASYGGALSRLHASLYPDEVEGLVLVDALNIDVLKIEDLEEQPDNFLSRVDALRNFGSLQVLKQLGMRPEEDDESPSELATAKRLNMEMLVVPKHWHAFMNEIRDSRVGFEEAKSSVKHLGSLTGDSNSSRRI